MSWVAVAVAGGAIGGSLISSNAASKARKSADQASANELAFAKAQYADWLDVFGDVQTNLSEYYNNLTPATYEASALQAFEQEKAAALTQLSTELAQRGISQSGLAGLALETVAVTSAAERAKIRAEAPMRTAQAKQEFLQIGLGQNPASNVYGALANRTNQTSADARLATSAAADATTAAVDTTFNALSAILKPKVTP